MGNFYFDIETVGLDPHRDKIITIQFQELGRNTGKATGELIILKEWESSEKEILEEFIKLSRITDPYPFTFIPVGFNLGFEHKFLKTRTRVQGIPSLDILDKPFIDLRFTGIIMNKGEFKGSGLDKITEKASAGSKIPEWYKNKEYANIISYIKNEAEEFIKLNQWLYQRLPGLLLEFRKNHQEG